MKDQLTSFLATAFKGLGGAGGYLAGKGLIDSGSIGSVDAAGSSMALALATILGAVAVHLLGKLFGSGVAGKSPLLILATAAGLSMAGGLLSSCSLSMTGDGCVLGSYTRNGRTYKAGPCVDALGVVNRLRFSWSNEKAQELRATVFKDRSKPTEIEYHAGGGLWLRWTKDSGISLGALPPDLESAVNDGAVKVTAVVETEREIKPAK